MKMLKISIAIALISLLSACASIISGTTQTISFDSNTKGAKVYLDGQLVGQTPFTYEAKKNKYNNLRIEKDGYKPVYRVVEKSFDPVTIISLFWDYSTTDAVTGAMFEYDENSYFIELEKE